MRGRMHYRLIINVLIVFLSSILLLFSCAKKPKPFTYDERKKADSMVHAVRNIDTLAQMQKQMEKEGNRLGSIIALRSLGERMRNESRFEEALSVHSEGLRQAEAIGDTLEWVRALNNIGTNYRRMGMLDVAQVYHYNAWKLSEESTDTSHNARKNRVVSLNGLGNIYMTLGNYELPIVCYAWRWQVSGNWVACWDKPSTMPTSAPFSNIMERWILRGYIMTSR